MRGNRSISVPGRPEPSGTLAFCSCEKSPNRAYELYFYFQPTFLSSCNLAREFIYVESKILQYVTKFSYKRCINIQGCGVYFQPRALIEQNEF